MNPPRRWINNKKNTPEYLEVVATTAAELAAEAIATATRRLTELNAELAEIDTRLREITPKRHGAMLMERTTCAPHGVVGCIGCPHIRWTQWLDPSKAQHETRRKKKTRREAAINPTEPTTPAQRKEGWIGVTIHQPRRKLRRSGVFEASYRETDGLIHKAQRLKAEKEALVAQISSLGKSLKQRARHRAANPSNPNGPEEG